MTAILGKDLYTFLSAMNPKKVELLQMNDTAQNEILSGAAGKADYELVNKIEGIKITPDNSMPKDEILLKVTGLPKSILKIKYQ